MKSLRLPLAAVLALTVAMPAFAEDDKKPTDPSRSTSLLGNTGKQVTLTGKIVDLHEYFTGQKDSSIKSDKPDSTRPDSSRPDATKPDSARTDTPSTSKPDASAKKMHGQYMALTNASIAPAASTDRPATGAAADRPTFVSGTVILCFAEAPSVFAVPRNTDEKAPSDRPSTDRPSTTPGTTTDRSDKTSAEWRDKQCQVTGTLYEKDGIKFLLVSSVKHSDSTTTTPRTTPAPIPAPK